MKTHAAMLFEEPESPNEGEKGEQSSAIEIDERMEKSVRESMERLAKKWPHGGGRIEYI